MLFILLLPFTLVDFHDVVMKSVWEPMQRVGERCAPEQASQPLGCSVSSPPVIHCGQGFYTNPQPCIVHSAYTPSSIIPTLPSAYTPCSICIHFNLTIVHVTSRSLLYLHIFQPHFSSTVWNDRAWKESDLTCYFKYSYVRTNQKTYLETSFQNVMFLNK